MQEPNSKAAQPSVVMKSGGNSLDNAQIEARGNVHVGDTFNIHQAAETPDSLERKISAIAEKLEIAKDDGSCQPLLNELTALSQHPLFTQLSGNIRKCVKDLLKAPDTKTIQFNARALALAIFAKNYLIPYEQLEIGTQLGHGSFGRVSLARYNHQAVAVKEIFGVLTQNDHKSLMEEIRIMLQLHSDFVVRLYGVSIDRTPTLVMECMNQRTLTELLGNSDIALNWLTRYQLAKDMASGLDVLHMNKIIHRDLKSMNVLLCHKDERYWAKISDFGLSQIKSSSKASSAGQAKSVGTLAWKAPELFGLKPKYSNASDMYAYAMVLWEMAARCIPFKGVDESEIKDAIKGGDRADIPEDCPEAMKGLIERLWDQKPDRRFTARQVITELEPLIAAEAVKEEKEEDAKKADMARAIQEREEEMLAKQKALEAAVEAQAQKAQAAEQALKTQTEQSEKAKQEADLALLAKADAEQQSKAQVAAAQKAKAEAEQKAAAESAKQTEKMKQLEAKLAAAEAAAAKAEAEKRSVEAAQKAQAEQAEKAKTTEQADKARSVEQAEKARVAEQAEKAKAEQAEKAQEAADKQLAEQLAAKEQVKPSMAAAAATPGVGFLPAPKPPAAKKGFFAGLLGLGDPKPEQAAAVVDDAKEEAPLKLKPANPRDIVEITDLLKQGNQDAVQAKLRKDPVLAASVELFLLFVAAGEQDQAETMLKANPRLAEAKGTVTDLSGRTFEDITGFQYAVWALDWHMWTMTLKYLPQEKAAVQVEELERDGTRHGAHFSFDPLINALDTCVKHYQASRYAEGNTAWVQQVGGAQLLLPAHVINEYCRPDRSFHPTPNFLEANLPRSLKDNSGGFWFTAEYASGKLGVKFGYLRYSFSAAVRAVGTGRVFERSVCEGVDLHAISTLSKARHEQLAELKSSLAHQVASLNVKRR